MCPAKRDNSVTRHLLPPCIIIQLSRSLAFRMLNVTDLPISRVARFKAPLIRGWPHRNFRNSPCTLKSIPHRAEYQSGWYRAFFQASSVQSCLFFFLNTGIISPVPHETLREKKKKQARGLPHWISSLWVLSDWHASAFVRGKIILSERKTKRRKKVGSASCFYNVQM